MTKKRSVPYPKGTCPKRETRETALPESSYGDDGAGFGDGRISGRICPGTEINPAYNEPDFEGAPSVNEHLMEDPD